MADRFGLVHVDDGFLVVDRAGNHDTVAQASGEAMGQRIVRLLNDEERWMSQEPPEASLDVVSSTQEARWQQGD
jgi:hypothetical protein